MYSDENIAAKAICNNVPMEYVIGFNLTSFVMQYLFHVRINTKTHIQTQKNCKKESYRFFSEMSNYTQSYESKYSDNFSISALILSRKPSNISGTGKRDLSSSLIYTSLKQMSLLLFSESKNYMRQILDLICLFILYHSK